MYGHGRVDLKSLAREPFALQEAERGGWIPRSTNQNRDRFARWIVTHTEQFAQSEWATQCKQRPPAVGCTEKEVVQWLDTVVSFPCHFAALLDAYQCRTDFLRLPLAVILHVGGFLTLGDYAANLGSTCRTARAAVLHKSNPAVHRLVASRQQHSNLLFPLELGHLVRSLRVAGGYIHLPELLARFPRLQRLAFDKRSLLSRAGLPMGVSAKGWNHVCAFRPSCGMGRMGAAGYRCRALDGTTKAFCITNACPWCQYYKGVERLPAYDTAFTCPPEGICYMALVRQDPMQAVPSGMSHLTRLVAMPEYLKPLEALWVRGEMPRLSRLSIEGCYLSDNSLSTPGPIQWPPHLISLTLRGNGTEPWCKALDLRMCVHLLRLHVDYFYATHTHLPRALELLSVQTVVYDVAADNYLFLPPTVTGLAVGDMGVQEFMSADLDSRPLGPPCWMPAPPRQPLCVLYLSFSSCRYDLREIGVILDTYPQLTSCELRMGSVKWHAPLDHKPRSVFGDQSSWSVDLVPDLLVRYIRRHGDRHVSFILVLDGWLWTIETPEAMDPQDSLDEFVQLFRWGCLLHGYSTQCPCVYPCRRRRVPEEPEAEHPPTPVQRWTPPVRPWSCSQCLVQ